MAIQEEEYI